MGFSDLFCGNNPRLIEQKIIEYLIHMKNKGKGYSTIHNYAASVLAFYKINDVALNITKINKFIPVLQKVRKDRAYTHVEIAKLLEIADERSRVIILLMTSSGIRVGALPLLRLGNLEDSKLTIYDNVREDFEYAFKMFSKALDSVLPRREAFQYKDDFTFLAKTRQRLKNIYGGVGLSLKIEGNKVQQMINDIIRSSKISTLIEQREVTDETFLSDVFKETRNKKARTALVKNKVRQIIEEKAHLNPVYYEKMKERLEAIIREEREERREDADYFNKYEKILRDLYGQEEERKKLGFTNAFEFAVYETLLNDVGDANISKDITKKIFDGIKEEITKIPDWQNKLTSQKKLEATIYDVLNETGNKKIESNIDDIIEQVIELAKRNLR